MAQDFADFVAEVKERADIVSLIHRYVPLKRSGSRFIGLCPFHNDHSPSMNVTPQMGIFKCFVCGMGGDIFKFLQEYDKLSFIDALKLVANDLGMTIPEKFSDSEDGKKGEKNTQILAANALAAEYFQTELQRSPEIRKYLEIRGISEEVYKFYQVGAARNSWDDFLSYARKKGFDDETLASSGLIVQKPSGKKYDRFVNRLMFPIWNLSNRIVAFGGRTLDKNSKPKYLNSSESPLYQKSRLLYGFNFSRNKVSNSGNIILVEGYMDILALKQVGIDNAASVSGTALTQQHAEMIAKFARKVYLFFDGDEAGSQAAWRCLPFLLNNGLEVKIPLLPSDEDPDSFALKYGEQKTSELLQQSSNIVEFMTRDFKKSNSSFSPEEKDRLYKTSLSLLNNISSQLVKMEYMHQLHEILDIPLKGIRFKDGNTLKAKSGDLGRSFHPLPEKKSLEWQLLQLILSRQEIYELALDHLKLEWIEDSFVSDLLDRILSFFGHKGEFKLTLLFDQLPEQQRSAIETVEILEFVDLFAAKRQFIDTITALEKRFVQKTMRQLNYQIRNRMVDRKEGYKKQIELQKRLKELRGENISLAPEKHT
jgi:DNA primase